MVFYQTQEINNIIIFNYYYNLLNIYHITNLNNCYILSGYEFSIYKTSLTDFEDSFP